MYKNNMLSFKMLLNTCQKFNIHSEKNEGEKTKIKEMKTKSKWDVLEESCRKPELNLNSKNTIVSIPQSDTAPSMHVFNNNPASFTTEGSASITSSSCT